jgi:hypothetical protein
MRFRGVRSVHPLPLFTFLCVLYGSLIFFSIAADFQE